MHRPQGLYIATALHVRASEEQIKEAVNLKPGQMLIELHPGSAYRPKMKSSPAGTLRKRNATLTRSVWQGVEKMGT
jgi:hypothetical protein